MSEHRGPLSGLHVLELFGIGALPFCGMLLSDLGATVTRIDRPEATELGIGVDPERSFMHRGRTALTLDLKAAGDRARFMELVKSSDVVLEAMRPGAVEKLGIGPGVCLAHNPRLIYGRLSGWGRTGDRASTAGHDINYLAVAGVLGLMGPKDAPPVPPLTLGADFPAGMLLALEIAAAVAERARTGRGAIVDRSLLQSAGLFTGIFASLAEMGRWPGERGENVLDGGAPYYRSYETSDGKFVAVGALEERFYAQLIERLELTDALPSRDDRANWPAIATAFAGAFRGRTRDEWTAVFAKGDACVTPVLALSEAAAQIPWKHPRT